MRSGRSSLIAEVYEVDKPLDAPYEDVRYYLQLLRGSGQRVLEVATGTGRFLVPLRDAGVAADGLDHSAEMLEICRRHCAERGHHPVLMVADMEDFDVPHRYDAVLLLSGVIKELAGREAALRALGSARRALVRGGTLFLDALPPRHVSGAVSPDHPTQPSPAQWWQRDEDAWCLQTIRLSYDSAANRTVKVLRYEKWHHGVLVRSEAHTFVIQHWTLWEIEQLLSQAGFVDLEVTANYTPGRRPGPADDDWTFRAVAP